MRNDIGLDKEPGQEPQAQRGPITRLLLDSRRVFFLAFGLTFVWEVLSLAPIIYMMNLFDRVMTSRSEVTLLSLTILFVVAIAFSSSVDWLRKQLLMRMALRLDWDLAMDVFNASFKNFVGHKRMNVQQIMGDLVVLRKFFQGSGFFTLVHVPFALVFVGVLYLFSPSLAAFALSALVLMVIFAVLKARAVTPLIREATKAAAETNRSVAESLRHSETALALGMQSAIRSRWYKSHQADLVLDANGHEAAGLIGGLAGLVTSAMPMLTKGFAVLLAIHGEITAGMVIASMFLVNKSINPLQALINQWPALVKAKMSMERLEKLLIDGDIAQDRVRLPDPVGVLSVESLTAMARNGRKKILYGIDFELQPGQVLAVVGPSASGKSTLARHLVGIAEPSEGAVRLDGAAIFDWIRSQHGPNIGYVPQDIMVLEGTVAENIARLGEINSEAVIRAAELIDLHQTILGFPQGYETVLGDDGYRLTGGQKQRLIIARALYKDPRLMVLDEPSSSLDAESVKALLRLIRILRKNHVTVVITTHRQNLVAAADYVLELEQGTQKAFGLVKEFGKQVLKDLNAPHPPELRQKPPGMRNFPAAQGDASPRIDGPGYAGRAAQAPQSAGVGNGAGVGVLPEGRAA